MLSSFQVHDSLETMAITEQVWFVNRLGVGHARRVITPGVVVLEKIGAPRCVRLFTARINMFEKESIKIKLCSNALMQYVMHFGVGFPF